jgi:hypothetical protein
MGLLDVLGLSTADPTGSGEPETPPLLLKENALVMDAHSAFTDYLALRDTADDAALLDEQLRAAQEFMQTWRSEIGKQGSDDNREKMTLLAGKIELERSALDELLEHVGDMDALIEAIDGENDPERRNALHTALQDVLQELPS